MKLREQQVQKAVSAESVAKARLRNVGNGTIEFGDVAIRFYVEKGHLKKQKKLAKEIPFIEVESIERVENELNITWKGGVDRFVLDRPELAEAIRAKMIEVLDAQRKTLEHKEEAPKQQRKELAQAVSNSIKIADSLFDILRSLHGRVDWNRLETRFKSSRENFRCFPHQEGAVDLDVAKLSSVIKEHLPEEISKEAYGILKAVFDYFKGLASEGDSPSHVHPTNDEAKKVVLAYYILNDIALGIMVEDEEVDRERNELVKLLDELAKVTGLATDTAAIKDAINKLNAETDRERAIEESRALFVQQLKALITA
ncbi:MAG: hypothetical protein NWE94_05635 [Candidatus Bathyarchaeota archaeon]|nr:hypothetical protein [Candidatus Bathyarchaeota archaeon]